VTSGRRRGVTIREVAADAGVSHQTVSRVINDQTNISPATRERVLESMRRLRYRPSRVARALASSRSRTIGIALTATGGYGPPKTLRSIEEAALEAGYFVNSVNIGAVDRRSTQKALAHLTDHGIDGLVMIAPTGVMLDALDEYEIDVPYVTVESSGRGGSRAIAIDHELGARLATRHLVELGHRRVLHVAGPADWFDAQARVRGWRAVLEEAGLPVEPPLVGDWMPNFGRDVAARAVIDSGATGVFVANDQMALGLLQALHRSGVRVPGDVSIVGFDDIPEAAFFWPPLTTVRPDFSELGRRCVALLLDQMAGREPTSATPVAPVLAVRESTAPAPPAPPGRTNGRVPSG